MKIAREISDEILVLKAMAARNSAIAKKAPFVNATSATEVSNSTVL
jgi:hypothetical protein